MTNPLNNTLYLFFDKLNVINGLLHHLNWQLQAFVVAVKPQLPELKVRREGTGVAGVFAASSLVVSDITEDPGPPRCYASGGFGSQDEACLEVATELVSRNAAFAVSQAWEVHETFLFDVTAAYLESFPTLADQSAVEEYQTKTANATKQTRGQWEQFVRWKYRGRDNRDLLKYLRELGPHFVEGEKKNHRQLDLIAWYRTLTKVRHAVTHAGLTLPPSDVAKIRSQGGDLLSLFPGAETQDGYTLELSIKDAESTLQLIAEHGFLVYKSLSRAGGYDWAVLGTARRVIWSGRQAG